MAALDPGSAGSQGPGQAQSPALIRTGWWVLWDPTDPPPPLEVHGLLPSPVALTPPSRPWNPLNLDWEVSWAPATTAVEAWTLAVAELEPTLTKMPSLAPPETVTGRSLLTGGPATVVAGATATAQGLDLSEVPAEADLMSAIFEGLTAQTSPAPPSLRAGSLQLTRARVVDTYGQHIDLVAAQVRRPPHSHTSRRRRHVDWRHPAPGPPAQLGGPGPAALQRRERPARQRRRSRRCQ